MNRRLPRALLVTALVLAGCGGGAAVVPADTGASTASGVRTVSDFERGLALGHFAPACGAVAAGQARCFAYVLTDAGRIEARAREMRGGARAISSTTVGGLGPAQLQSAYGTASAKGGAGAVIAVVDAYDDPNLEADLGVYRAQFGLAACTTANGCFQKVGQTGSPAVLPHGNASWGQETSLDVDMVSANCPNCSILVVEADSSSFGDLATAVNTAVRLGATAVSNSYGSRETSSGTAYRSAYDHPGVAITASSGDTGYGTQSPASFGTLTAVGGTSLTTASTKRGWSETVWSGSGSGCSKFEAKPSFQHDPSCANRMIADVAYDADPYTGVAVYDTFGSKGQGGWLVFGGTSVGSPSIAAIYGLAGKTVSDASLAYANASALNDVVSGTNGNCPVAYFCTAETGYDGPTGNGTPSGTTGF